MALIIANNMSYKYNKKDDFEIQKFSLKAEEGDIYGIIGGADSGKTTVIKLLSGLFKPDTGYCYIMGRDPYEEPEIAHEVMGVITKSAECYNYLSGIQNLTLFGTFYGLSKSESNKRAARLMRKMNLFDIRNKKLSLYNSQEKKRMSICRALLNNPKILILDEPTKDLDYNYTSIILNLLKDFAKEENHTVIIATNGYLGSEKICNKYIFLKNGNSEFYESKEQIILQKNALFDLNIEVSEHELLTGFEKHNKLWTKKIKSRDEVPSIIKNLVNDGHNILSVNIKTPEINDLYYMNIHEDK